MLEHLASKICQGNLDGKQPIDRGPRRLHSVTHSTLKKQKQLDPTVSLARGGKVPQGIPEKAGEGRRPDQFRDVRGYPPRAGKAIRTEGPGVAGEYAAPGTGCGTAALGAPLPEELGERPPGRRKPQHGGPLEPGRHVVGAERQAIVQGKVAEKRVAARPCQRGCPHWRCHPAVRGISRHVWRGPYGLSSI